MLKKMSALLLTLIMIIAPMGQLAGASDAGGRYIESAIDLGEGVTAMSLRVFDGATYIMAYAAEGEGGDWVIYHHDGENAELMDFPSVSEYLDGRENIGVADFFMDAAGSPVFVLLEYAVPEEGSEESPTSATGTLLFAEGDGYRGVPVDESINIANLMSLEPVEGGYALCTLAGAYIIDAEGKILRDFPSNGGYGMFAASGNALYSIDLMAAATGGAAMIQAYDITSGSETESFEAPEIDLTALASVRLATDAEGNLYFFSGGGVYRRSGEGWELVLDSMMTMLADPTATLRSVTIVPDGQIYMLGYKVNTATFSSEQMFYTYKWSTDPALATTTEINILSVADHTGVRAAISEYTRSHPEVKINYRSFVDGLSFMNMGYDTELDAARQTQTQVNDAISAINTEVLAGNPPDILLLDYLPMENYMNQGFLMDLNEYVGSRTTDGTWTTNIADAYRREDGSLLALPTRFAVPVLWGSKADTDQITDIRSLVEFTKTLPAEEHVLMTYGATMLVSMLYPTSYMDWENEEGMVDFRGEAFREFAEMVKEIQDTLPQRSLEEIQTVALKEVLERTIVFYNDWLAGSTSQLASLALMRSRKEPVGLIPVPNQGGGRPYMPQQIVSIGRNTENKEIVYEFLDVLLGSEAQQADMAYSGYPVNAAALDELLTPMTEEELAEQNYFSSVEVEGYTLEIGPIDEEAAAQIRAVVDGLDTPSTPNYTLLSMVLEAMRPYLDGSQSLDEMINQLSSRSRALLLE